MKKLYLAMLLSYVSNPAWAQTENAQSTAELKKIVASQQAKIAEQTKSIEQLENDLAKLTSDLAKLANSVKSNGTQITSVRSSHYTKAQADGRFYRKGSVIRLKNQNTSNCLNGGARSSSCGGNSSQKWTFD
ncbi:MAG: hypothetical protein HRU19_12565 [Pseudobacteriovorax sp.]|nr:hypothetical protein [Pseudobacteriovorax sp.]